MYSFILVTRMSAILSW